MVLVLHYFNVRSRGELIRFLAAEGNIQLEEKNPTDWKEQKETTPFGQLPVLEDTENPNFKISQSLAIARHVAKLAGLYPTSLQDQAVSDYLVDTVNDLRGAAYKAYYSKNVEMNQKHRDETLPFFLERFEQILKKNGGEFFVGPAFSWCDVAVFDCLEESTAFAEDLLDKYPTLKAFFDKMAQRPGIKARRESPARPGNYIKGITYA